MITVVVQFQLPKGTTREEVFRTFQTSTSRYHGMPGLIRKYYLYGDEGVAGGAYLWEGREAAEAVYTDEWRQNAKKRYGVEPTIAYFETPLVVDNDSGDQSVERLRD